MSEKERDRLFHINPQGNLTGEDYLEQYLTKIEEQYSYERLSGLPESQLQKELRYVNEHIERIVSEFPGLEEDSTEPAFHAWVADKEYAFDPLSKEQVAEMNFVIQQAERNINRALHEEYVRRQEQRGKIGRWIVDLIDALTPGSRQEMSVNIPKKERNSVSKSE